MLKTRLGARLLGLFLLMGACDACAQTLSLRWISSEGAILDERVLSLKDLESLKQSEIDTTTPWSSRKQRFVGPSLGELADITKRRVVTAKVAALNDYSATIPAEDWTDHGAILAIRLNGELQRVRDRGPWWVMYPIDSDPKLRELFYQARMVWQVKSIEFVVQ